MNKLFASCLFFLTGTIHSSAADESMFRSAYAAHDVALDTDTQSAFWQGATPVYMEIDIMGRAEPAYERKSARDGQRIIFIFFMSALTRNYNLKPSPDHCQ